MTALTNSLPRPFKFAYRKIRSFSANFAKELNYQTFRRELSFAQLQKKSFSRNRNYRYFEKAFKQWIPQSVRDHRQYFSQEMRGFGEDPFHAAWYSIFQHFKPKKALEIGVYRGQTISLWAMLARELGIEVEIYGISPLTSQGDEVSHYKNINYEKDIEINFHRFDLPTVKILKYLSTDLKAKKVIESGQWDLIYVDGSHDYDIVVSDIASATRGLRKGGILVLDDSSLYTNFRISTGEAFRGHEGPSRAFKEINKHDYDFLLGVGHNNFLIRK